MKYLAGVVVVCMMAALLMVSGKDTKECDALIQDAITTCSAMIKAVEENDINYSDCCHELKDLVIEVETHVDRKSGKRLVSQKKCSDCFGFVGFKNKRKQQLELFESIIAKDTLTVLKELCGYDPTPKTKVLSGSCSLTSHYVGCSRYADINSVCGATVKNIKEGRQGTLRSRVHHPVSLKGCCAPVITNRPECDICGSQSESCCEKLAKISSDGSSSKHRPNSCLCRTKDKKVAVSNSSTLNFLSFVEHEIISTSCSQFTTTPFRMINCSPQPPATTISSTKSDKALAAYLSRQEAETNRLRGKTFGK